MRLIDADEAKKLERMLTLKPSERMLFRMMLARMPTYEPPNDPLTLEQLLEMDREPVYCITDYEITVNGEKGHRLHTEGWGIVTGTDLGDQGFVAGTACTHYLEHYGKTWLAYRRKPEEGTR